MKTTVLKILMIVFLLATISACSSDDDNSGSNYTEENFMAGYIEATGFGEVIEINAALDSEFGLDFTPKVNGKITALRMMLPEVNSNLRVTIWNKTNNTIYKTEIVNVSSADTEFVFDITDLDLVKDNEYAITMNTKDWYKRIRGDEAPVVYPFTVGNIQINAHKWVNGPTQTYPTNMATNYYAGDLSFDFIQIE